MARTASPRRVLLIAYHYPPFGGSSGVQRTLKNSIYLRDFGWTPFVLTASPSAYVETRSDLLAEVPADLRVYRAWALDAARHLSVAKRFPRWAALPDRWSSWIASAVPLAAWLVRRHAIDAIWSTYPIASAQLIGLATAKLTGRPWIADFRDPMVDADFPSAPSQRRMFHWIERKVAERAQRIVATTPGALRDLRSRYPALPAERLLSIPNGYDEADFAAEAPPRSQRGPRLLLHSGVLYPSERDPTQLFSALAAMRDAGRIDAQRLRIRLRATGHDAELGALIERQRVGDLVEIAPPLPHRRAIAEMQAADGLLLLQAANCNHQIPAKAYEYLRTGTPVFTLTDRSGDTGSLMLAAGQTFLAPLADAGAIGSRLADFLAALDRGDARGAPAEVAAQYSRRAQAMELANLLSTVVDEKSPESRL